MNGVFGGLIIYSFGFVLMGSFVFERLWKI